MPIHPPTFLCSPVVCSASAWQGNDKKLKANALIKFFIFISFQWIIKCWIRYKKHLHHSVVILYGLPRFAYPSFLLIAFSICFLNRPLPVGIENNAEFRIKLISACFNSFSNNERQPAYVLNNNYMYASGRKQAFMLLKSDWVAYSQDYVESFL